MRASGKDDAIQLTPAIKYSLEQALDFIEDDELVEITPKEIRLRKKFLTERPQEGFARRLSQHPVSQSGYNPDPHRHPGLHVIALLEASKAMLALLAATGLEVLGPQPLRHGIMA